MLFIKMYALFVMFFVVLMAAVKTISDYLQGKPKSNRFRKWWTNNMVDLDNLYK